jgi:hypothetical protein
MQAARSGRVEAASTMTQGEWGAEWPVPRSWTLTYPQVGRTKVSNSSVGPSGLSRTPTRMLLVTFDKLRVDVTGLRVGEKWLKVGVSLRDESLRVL